MTDTDFDNALITAAFQIAADQGWRNVTVPAAARAAGLPLAEARARFPSRGAILLRFGRLADQMALTDAVAEGPVRDRLFDLIMRRFDALQAHREGVRALLRVLPSDPLTALMLAYANNTSMRWMLQAAGVAATGPRGELQANGLNAVWLWSVRAWDRDESEDLSGTMAAVDKALDQAEQMASWLHRPKPSMETPPPPPPVAPGAGMIDPSDPIPAGDPPASDPPPSGAPSPSDPLVSGPPPSEPPSSDPLPSDSPPPDPPPSDPPPSPDPAI